jgi:hypothetical protein
VRRLAVALVHAPVLARDGGETVSTVTNLDIHDIARSCKTYGVSDYFIVHPVEAQRSLVGRITEHWKSGSSGERIPTRSPALELVRTVNTLEDAVLALGGRDHVSIWATAARASKETVGFATGREMLHGEGGPVLLIFGTSWGLPARVIASCDALLEPIQEHASYNHLSVRAACAIGLDRLARSS